MKIKLNSFAAAISVVFSLLVFSSAFLNIYTHDLTGTLHFSFYFPFLDSAFTIFSRIGYFLIFIGPALSIIFTLFCRRCALPALLIPIGCLFLAFAIEFAQIFALGVFDTEQFLWPLIIAIIFGISVVLCCCFYKSASKLGLVIIFFAVPTALIASLALASYKNIGLESLIVWSLQFLSLGMLSLALEPKVKHFELPEEPEEQPEITVKVESASLSQTLNTLLDKYNNGEISKEEYDALKRETLWKI